MSRRRAPIRAALLLGLGLALLPLPAGAAEPQAAASASWAGEPAHAFAMSLHHANDLVPQTNFVQCVGASMQTMLNVMARGSDRTATTQLRLQRLAHKWSGPRPDGRIRHGASVRGWADGLTLLGVGPYKLVGERTLEDALRTAAIAIRATGKPVGLLMWRGRHAWVMTGFRATADPLRTDAFRVTGVNVFDPLYPHGSGVWGPSPRPGALISPAALGRQFLPRRSNARTAMFAGLNPLTELRGKYVLVLPYVPRPPAPRDARVL